MPEMLRAYRVDVLRYGDDSSSIVVASTRGAAAHAVLSLAHEAGYTDLTYGDLRTLRAPTYDGLARHAEAWKRKAWSLDYAVSIIDRYPPEEVAADG